MGTSAATTGGAGSSGAGNGGGGGAGGTTVPDAGGESDAGADASVPPGPPCSAEKACSGANVCVVGNVCAPIIKASCASDGECRGDSYCCGPGCRIGGGDPVCIPYGAGPRGIFNPECRGSGSAGGVFSPAVQCEWPGPAKSDPNPDSANVLVSPLVADLPNDSGTAAEIVIITYNGNDGTVNPSTAPGKYGVIRIINGQTCELQETVADPRFPLRASAAPALADLDGDGKIDIVARRNDRGLVAFGWDDSVSHFTTKWSTDGPGDLDISNQQAWDGPSIFDINDDGVPEVLLRGAVYDGRTGAMIYDGAAVPQRPFNGLIPVVGSPNNDGKAKLFATINNEITFFGWQNNQWADEGADQGVHFGLMASHFALADFGTPGATAADFDSKHLDGVAEIVAVFDETGVVSVHTMNRQTVMLVNTGDRGGPPVVGDLDKDGFPEIGVAGKTRFRVFDFDCKQGGNGCENNYVRWSQPSQDGSSAQTSAAIFDFDSDGRAEVVYADECFLRVYEGDTGTVVYSAYRTSGTWYENPLVADVDRDDSTEIVVNSNTVGIACPPMSSPGTPHVDPIHPGVRCDNDAGCIGNSRCVEKLCRCTDNGQCAAGTTCVAPLAGTTGAGNVCRATHPNSQQQSGIRVLRDRLDRWASSRPLWNQHAYSITNINDDGTVPRTSSWTSNWKVAGLNNYRQNARGRAGATDYPDVTSSLRSNACTSSASGMASVAGTVCNRGKKVVGARMPATFYRGAPADGNVLCVAYAQNSLPVGGCARVSCDVVGEVLGAVALVANDDGKGGRSTVECNADNNRDDTSVERCAAP